MLDEYFRVGIDSTQGKNGSLVSLPEIVPGHAPLPHAVVPLLLRVCEQVDWNDEKACFETLAAELAECYAQFPMPPPRESATQAMASAAAAADKAKQQEQNTEAGDGGGRGGPDDNDPRRVVKNVLLPALRRDLVPYEEHADPDKGFVRQVAALEVLYKIFERC